MMASRVPVGYMDTRSPHHLCAASVQKPHNLLEISERWMSEEDYDWWPWLWGRRNAYGPCTIFVTTSLGDDVFPHVWEQLAKEDSTKQNVVVVCPVGFQEKYSEHIEKLSKQGAAFVEGDLLQVDVTSKIIMCADDRIICYEKLVLL